MKCTACNRSAEQCISFAHRTCRAIYLAFVFHTAVQARHSISYKHLQSFSLVYVYIINIIFLTVYASRSFSAYSSLAESIFYYREREAEDSFILIHPRRREEVQEEKESGKRGNEDDATYSRYTHIRYGECSKWRTCCGLPLCADGDGCDTERHADAHGRSRHDDILCRQTCARRRTHIDEGLQDTL